MLKAPLKLAFCFGNSFLFMTATTLANPELSFSISYPTENFGAEMFSYGSRNDMNKSLAPEHVVYLKKRTNPHSDGSRIKWKRREMQWLNTSHKISAVVLPRSRKRTRIPFYIVTTGKILIRTTGLGQEIILPLSSLAITILEKFNYPSHLSSEAKACSLYLKNLDNPAEGNNSWTITKTIPGAKGTIVYKKWKLLSSNTGKLGQNSDCIREGIKRCPIFIISGRRSIKVFQGFARINQIGKHDLRILGL